MHSYTDDTELLKRQRKFIEEIERSIRVANREILQDRIPELNQQSFVRMADYVAGLRANYLQGALSPDRETDAASWAARLRQHRQTYEEACNAFDALQRAIECGYVDIGVEESAGAAEVVLAASADDL